MGDERERESEREKSVCTKRRMKVKRVKKPGVFPVEKGRIAL